MALFLVASCLGISSSMKGELGIRIKFFSFLLYFFLASLNSFLMLINIERVNDWKVSVYPAALIF